MTGTEQLMALERVRACLMKKPNGKVLVVGSQPEEVLPTCQKLRSFGLDVICCATIPDAEKHIFEVNLAIVFLDMLHWDDTFHLLSLVKKEKPHCFVIILTGPKDAYSGICKCRDALSRGADAVMLKPLTTEQIALIFNRP